MKKNKIINSKSILKSVQKAINKMLLKTAELNGDIVVSDGKGNPIRIKAKQALKELNS